MVLDFQSGQKYINVDGTITLTILSIKKGVYKGTKILSVTLESNKGTAEFDYNPKQAKSVIEHNKLSLKY